MSLKTNSLAAALAGKPLVGFTVTVDGMPSSDIPVQPGLVTKRASRRGAAKTGLIKTGAAKKGVSKIGAVKLGLVKTGVSKQGVVKVRRG